MMVSHVYSVGCLVHSPFRFSQDLQSKNGIVSATLSIFNSKGPEGAGGTPLIIMVFTDREKKAIMAVAVAMAGIDNDADPREVILIGRVSEKIGIDVNRHAPIDENEALNVISAMTPAEKRFVCAYLGGIMAADGKIDARERLLWAVFSARCDFPTMALSECLQYVMDFLK